MRYVTVRVTPTEGRAFHPLGQQLADEPAVTREALHKVQLLDDGTGVMLAEDRGDEGRYREILRTSEYVHGFDITAGDGWWYSYIHFEPNDAVREMVERRRESPVVTEMPVEICPDGAQIVTLLGTDEALAQVVVDAPDVYETEVVEVGDRQPDARDPFACLTERQREILDAALDCGYYRNPRGATQEDVAAAVGATPSTVGEHLRKIEARVFSQFQ